MTKRLALFSTFCLAAALSLPAADDKAEERDLEHALSEAGVSNADFIRALEQHLAKYPQTARRPELERALAKAAIETGDNDRIVRYGEHVLAREPGDVQLLERVARALLVSPSRDAAERALKYARRYEDNIRKIDAQKSAAAPPAGKSNWRDEVDRALARAFVLQARANGSLGRLPDAVALARKSFDTFPSAEAARETGKWLARSGQDEEAVRRFAEAFTIPDPRAKDSERAADRARMGELYRKLHGSEAGLGDLVLDAYDRTTALVNQRELRLQQLDPNRKAAGPMEFTLSGLAGDKLPLASLKGKVVILDFWATWCGPCRIQHPMYEQVKKRFKDKPVVFLSINTDEDRATVPEFVQEHHWDNKVYYEDGLAAALRIDSIPTAILINKHGDVESRLPFIPDRFIDMLSQRIEQALTE